MKNEILFQEIQEEHLPQVLEIYNFYILNSTATFHMQPLSLEEMRELVFFDDPKYQTFIIKDSGIICGYVIVTQFKKREAYGETAEVTIYLSQDYTKKGIGSLAISHAEHFAHEQHFHVLVAGICGENRQSIRLFEKNGYTKCAQYQEIGRKFGRYLDVVYYQKILS